MFEATCAANASCISMRSMSESSMPARSSAFGIASAGPISSCPPGSTAATAQERTKASGSRPSARAFSSAISSTAAAAVGERRRVAGGDACRSACRRPAAAPRAPRATCPCAAGCRRVTRLVARAARRRRRSPAASRPSSVARPAVAVRRERDLVLLLARDAVLLRHLLGGLAHREAGRRLGDGRRLAARGRAAAAARGSRAARRATAPSAPRRAPAPCAGCSGIGTSDRLSAPPAMPGVDVPEQDLGGHVGDRLAGRGAGAVHGVGGDRPCGSPASAGRPRGPGSGPCTDGTTWPITTHADRAPGRPPSARAARARRPSPGRRRSGRGRRSPSARRACGIRRRRRPGVLAWSSRRGPASRPIGRGEGSVFGGFLGGTRAWARHSTIMLAQPRGGC